MTAIQGRVERLTRGKGARADESGRERLKGMRFELFIAARYLRAKRRQAVIGVVTAISVVGVAAGVGALIVALAITNGMKRDLEARLLGSTAHVDLMRVAADGMKNWQPLVERLRRLPHVTAAAPGLYGQVLISRGAKSGGGLIKGVVPEQEETVSDLLQSVKQGSSAGLSGAAAETGARTPGLVIGKDMAETLGAGVGDTVLVTSPQGALTPLGIVPRYEKFQVAGDLCFGVLSVRLQLCVYAVDGCAEIIFRARRDLGCLL